MALPAHFTVDHDRERVEVLLRIGSITWHLTPSEAAELGIALRDAGILARGTNPTTGMTLPRGDPP